MSHAATKSGASKTPETNNQALLRARFRAALRASLGVDRYRFQGKVVIVTGGARGLGLELSRRLARLGAHIAIVSSGEEELERARADLRSSGFEALTVRADLRDVAQVASAVRAIRRQLGPIDVLVNNSELLVIGPMSTMTAKDFEETIQENFCSALLMSQAVLPEMRKRGSGRIINIPWINGQIAIPHMLPVTASRFALMGLSQGMRSELLWDGVVVTTACPGAVRTGTVYNMFFKGQHRAELTWFILATSLPFFSMSAKRAARLILRAASQGRAQVTLGWQAKLMARIQGVIPSLMTDHLALVNQLLPKGNGIGTRRIRGRESLSSLASSFLTTLTRRAARRNNEL